MRLKTRLELNSIVTLTIVVLLSFALAWSWRQAAWADRNTDLASELERTAFERTVLRDEYLLNQSERARTQWNVKTEEFSRLLSEARNRFTEPADRALIETIQDEFDGTRTIFSRLVESRERGKSSEGEGMISQQGEKRLIGQILIRAYDLSACILTLEESARRTATAAHESSVLLVVILLAASVMITVGNSVVINSLLARRVAELLKGTEIMGAGNLAHRIHLTGDDEFSDLARAGNQMAARLRKSHTSVSNLNREIAERKLAEEALRESEEKYRTLFENMTEEVHFWQLVRDETGRIETWRLVDANPPMLKTWGRTSADEIKGKTTDEIFGPGATEHYMPVVQKIVAEGVPYSFEDYFPKLDKHFRFTSVPLGDYFITTGADITGIKKAEAAVTRAHERTRQVLHSIAEGYYALDDQWRFTELNPVAERHFKGTAASLVGEEFRQVTGTPRESLLFQKFEEAVVSRQPVQVEAESRINPGNWSALFLYPREEGLEVYFHDITERKQAEDSLRENEGRLRASLAEKEVLLREIHHRVKNNLQVISSLVGLQADGSQDEKVREGLRDLTYRVRSMALVHEKLYRSGDLAHIDFAEYARSLLSSLWRAHGEIAASVRMTPDLEPVSLPVDTAIPCGLILNELAGNALKHAFKGRSDGEVLVSLRKTAEGLACLKVRDNGAGLPEGFEWRQAHSLGLRLVQMLAGQLHAAVEVSSNEGTEFSVVIHL
jgi:two-component sensor histidine kinase/HAMP domain-containing protein